MPVRVATSGDELILVAVATGETLPVFWPAGIAAWRVNGRAVVVNPWGTVIGREGLVLDGLGGGEDLNEAFHICPYDIAPAGP
ncbi:MAG: hypothetical protein WEB29_08670 [Chloroflexota bacterium]